MSRTRRLAAIGGLALATIAVSATEPAAAGFGWAVVDWAVVQQPGGPVVSGTIDASFGRITQVELTSTPQGPLAGCESPTSAAVAAYPDDDTVEGEGTPVPDPGTNYRQYDFAIPIAPACNGRFTAHVVGTRDLPGDAGDDPASDDEESDAFVYEDDGEPVLVPVAIAPPAIAGVNSNLGADRRITVGWQPPTGWGSASACDTLEGGPPPPDFLGYEVRRSVNGGPTTAVASPAPGTHCFSEAITAESPLGEYRYEVVARRSGVDGTLVSAAVATTVAVGPPTTTPEESPTTVFRPPAPAATSAASGGGAATAAVPPTLADDTFDETLDYDEEPGDLAADVPDDADTFLDFVPSPGQGILVPFAIAECLAVWALHLRYLARRADDGY